MATWTWVLADEDGIALAELTGARDRRISFRRNGVPEAACGLSLEDPTAGDLYDVLAGGGIPQLRAYRDSALRFSGQLWTTSDAAEHDALVTVTFRGPFATLLGDGSNTGRFTAALREFAGTDAGTLAWTLIDEANSDSDTLIRQGTIEATVARDRTYEHKNVGDAIVELTGVQDGFDFEVDPLDPNDAAGKLGEFNVYAEQGEDRPLVIFEYGADTLRNVASVTRTKQRPINKVRVLGTDGIVGEAEHAVSIAKYGLFMRVESYDAADAGVLGGRAQAALRPDPITVVEYVPDPALAPQPWDDYWIGDTVRFRARRGALIVSEAPRVNGVDIAIDDNGHEAEHKLTFEVEG